MPGPLPLAGYPLRDGYATLITIAAAPGVQLYERETTPPALDGGGPIETTSMRTAAWRNKDPKTLKGLGDVMATVMYSTNAYNTISGIINTMTIITVRWPDGATLVFYGFVDKFTPSGHSEGNLPTANIVIIPSLRNPNTGGDASPVFTPAA